MTPVDLETGPSRALSQGGARGSARVAEISIPKKMYARFPVLRSDIEAWETHFGPV
jgi:hypothetical protein